eukprot:Skav206864  [mRNA]  locus=scaffold898:34060:37578:- [translate_table: standard]
MVHKVLLAILALQVVGENLEDASLAADDQCKEEGCALNALQKRSLATDDSGCPAGLGRAVGGAPCSPCPEGTYSEEGSAVCTRCAAGFWNDRRTYGDAFGLTECVQCPEGTWTGAMGSIRKDQCSTWVKRPEEPEEPEESEERANQSERKHPNRTWKA